MKGVSFLVISLFISTITIVGQDQPSGLSRPSPTSNSIAVPAAKVAVIDTELFYDEKAGITKLVLIDKQLASEFQLKIDELKKMSIVIETKFEELRKLSESTGEVHGVNNKVNEYEKLVQEFKVKEKEVKDAYNKRKDELSSPVKMSIKAALDDFMKTHGITLVIDLNKSNESVLSFVTTTDVTSAFIYYYNRRSVSKQ